jgi:hydroxymethylglutaryl-CoA lyase
MSNVARITDVAPRDGLQNETGAIPTASKVRRVELLCAARVDEVEVSSFVPARWIPQLADAAEVFAAAAAFKPADVVFSALVPNERGLQGSLAVNERAGRRVIDKVSVFTAASETFARRNTNGTIAETIERFVPVVRGAAAAGLRVRGYVSCVVACPFEGPIAPAAVADVVRRLVDIGVEEIDLGETIGVAHPDEIEALLAAVTPVAPLPRLTLHLHDTHDTYPRTRSPAAAAPRTTGTNRSMVSAIVPFVFRRAARLGVRSFDGAAGGLGGCPYASTPTRRAPGNIDTRTLLAALRAEGVSTRVDEPALAAAAEFGATLRSDSRTVEA